MFVHLELKKKAFFGHSFIYKMKTKSHSKITHCFKKSFKHICTVLHHIYDRNVY